MVDAICETFSDTNRSICVSIEIYLISYYRIIIKKKPKELMNSYSNIISL